MALNKLYYVYGLDTACFYTDEENAIEQKIIKARSLKNKLKKTDMCIKRKNQIYFLNTYISKYKNKLKELLSENVNVIRNIRLDKILNKDGQPSLKRRVSIFDSNLTRCFGLVEREFNEEIVIVKVYFFDVAESIIKNGFYMNGEKYVFFSASAGQIRTKKLVAVREDLLNKHWNTLTAGLTRENINAQGGMNINKYLAYLSLCNSGTDVWDNFDIDRCIVVDDFENTVHGVVDYIDDKTFEITRMEHDLPVAQVDGVGMMLPCVSNVNFMTRLPWVKGLLATFDFVKFINENNASPILTDIYGIEHNILKENIQIIFTKSQFKMWKYYSNWNEYKDNFKKYNCTAAKCNIEEDNFDDSVINYQMIQTLSDLSDDEIKSLANLNDKDLNNLSKDMGTMLRVFGAVSWNNNKDSFQKCLEKYPELLSDAYSRQTLREIKNKLEKELWSARFNIEGKYTFVIPDLYAFCEWLFLKQENPQGLLKDGEVCCKLFNNGEKLDCLRSPHLFIEHPIKKNNTNIEWFSTNAIYISCHDFISRIVQCDFDGDRLLVTNNKTLVEAAERNNKEKNIVPLFYVMSKAKAEVLSSENIYKGLITAYTGGNIGEISNSITKIWNSGEITDEKLKVIKWLVMINNFVIDFAKTLYKPEIPAEVEKIISKYTKSKVPAFFMYAKKKTNKQVKSISDSSVDRIHKIYKKRNLNYNFKQDNIGVFDYKVLMNNPDTVFVQEVADRFKKVSSTLKFNKTDDKKFYNKFAVYEKAKNEIMELGYDEKTVVDILIIDLFYNRKIPKKKAFWTLFGDTVYENICKNIADNFVMCNRCHKRFYRERPTQKYCFRCQGYQKQRVKTITCCDCGREFEVDARNMTKTRCDKCQKTISKQKTRLRVQRFREKQ